MKKTLHFSTVIDAPRLRVWERMLAPDSYRDWTSAFCEGSYYEGSWEQGQQIRFFDPQGHGMAGEIARNEPHSHISIRHLAFIKDGVLDTDSPQARAWLPAYENYRLTDEGQGTRLDVDLQVTPEYEEMMQRLWPQALERLKALCERA